MIISVELNMISTYVGQVRISQEYLGFDIWGTYTSFESDSVFKCLRCDKEDEDCENMKSHIQEKHNHKKH